MTKKWQQGELVELEIVDLNSSGEGVGKINGKVVFIPDTVTGDRALVRLTKVKNKYSYGKIEQLLIASPYRIRPRCIVADKCGGCQWQHIDWEYQLDSKRQQVLQALQRIGGFSQVQVKPTLHTPYSLNYRNKSTYPLGISASGQVQAGYYRQGSHQLINLNQCPVQDARLHPLLAEVKQDLQKQGWTIYNEKTHQGQLRHLSLRIGNRTGEILLTLVTTDKNLTEIEAQAQTWLTRYPQLVGVCLNYNPERTNVIFGQETITVAGSSYLREIFAGVELNILSDTFFQVNTEAAELLLSDITKQLNLEGDETIVDAYCGIGTFTLPLAKQAKSIVGIELHPTSVEQAKQNANINQITNVTFYAEAVETLLPQLEFTPDLILLDPPRKGCEPQVIETLINLSPSPRIIYVSCKPATLARDLNLLCQSGKYQLNFVQPVDFFPQTTHIESYAYLNATS
ncbi:23S rRNA m(5)U-1939 methyltransferase [Stanieria cyanosphaera PCC 7437]|uniref:23S rRNA m(5)U-1939 methyltransferase n=1 Tax=Stanieria cyanosphaera (strain ATCC 29371 / PCC 7437) TaxID=111780 RepID=K9XRS8_STAC7|nr:23S rRNA (uracil(1939)-C(5))-methyltransferase RlmD [Stanieria cyanosphaera]AFZ35315.1 23S rRNA m(5)U-1939 methyltransferase [Stanieria cyanosphaera PCC 7437]